MILDDARKYFLRSRWVWLALLLEMLAVANDHISDIQPILGDRYGHLASFGLPILLVVLRFQSAKQQSLSMKPVKPDQESQP